MSVNYEINPEILFLCGFMLKKHDYMYIFRSVCIKMSYINIALYPVCVICVPTCIVQLV